ncbi:MAG TPA: cysteine desulfurase [Cytophagales bacterium]|jgi:cysteine desulfurase|nr:cysteine desulfurase [Cytophagales bacterium]
MRVYLDNAATTRLDETVLEAMKPYLLEQFGNPSSIHTFGREAKVAIEKARRQVAEILSVGPAEIFFTSGGTEADNMAIINAVKHFGIQNIITSKIEHHAVLHTVEYLEKQGDINVHFVEVDELGNIKYDQLEQLLKQNDNSLVTLMHGNNEIGNISEIDRIGELCEAYKAIFHSDTVQTVGHFNLNFEEIKVHYAAASAHKFHGPKGVGFMYMDPEKMLPPMIHGGGQERNMRGGTENVAGIIGLAKALELAVNEMDKQREYITTLKKYAIDKLRQEIPTATFNGNCLDLENSLYTVLNVGVPAAEDNEMLLFNLDIKGVAVSGGSACSSGSNLGSHVLEALNANPYDGAIRMSFSKFNTQKDIDYAVEQLAEIVAVKE